MRAAVIRSSTLAPSCEDVPEPSPSPGEVVVEVTAAALHPRVRAEAAGSHYSSSDAPMPRVAGIDGVGIDPQGHRVFFLRAHHEHGTMAERISVPADALIPLPDGVDDATAAAVLNPAMSSWLALAARAHLQPGESVLVLGATGAAGSTAVQIARLLGATRVVAVGRDPRALAALGALGCDAVVRLGADTRSVAVEIGAQAGDVDVVVDYLWGDPSLHALQAITGARSDPARPLRWVNVGAAAGDDIVLPGSALRQMAVTVLGSGTGSLTAAAITAQVRALAAHLPVITPTLTPVLTPLNQVNRAWDHEPGRGQRTVLQP